MWQVQMYLSEAALEAGESERRSTEGPEPKYGLDLTKASVEEAKAALGSLFREGRAG